MPSTTTSELSVLSPKWSLKALTFTFRSVAKAPSEPFIYLFPSRIILSSLSLNPLLACWISFVAELSTARKTPLEIVSPDKNNLETSPSESAPKTRSGVSFVRFEILAWPCTWSFFCGVAVPTPTRSLTPSIWKSKLSLRSPINKERPSIFTLLSIVNGASGLAMYRFPKRYCPSFSLSETPLLAMGVGPPPVAEITSVSKSRVKSIFVPALMPKPDGPPDNSAV